MSFAESVLLKVSALIAKVFGSANDREIKRLWPMVEKVKNHYPAVEKLRDEELGLKTDEFRVRLCKGETLDEILFEAYAVCREAAHRTLGNGKIIHDKWINQDIRYFGHFDVQILGGIVQHEGKISEMVTGEGKTLVATLPAYLNGLAPSEEWKTVAREVQGENIDEWKFLPFVKETLETDWKLADNTKEAISAATSTRLIMPIGNGVHIITVNDYLAERDCEDNRPLYEFLGLTVGAISAGMESNERIPMYMCDITHGQNNEFGFDYLRDNLKTNSGSQAQAKRAFAIIDEVDSILIDESRTPLIISGHGEKATDKYYTADRVARKLNGRHQNEVDESIMEMMRKGYQREDARMSAEEGVDFIFSERDHSTKITEQGQNRVLQLLGIKDLYSGNNLEWLHYIDNALSANSIYKCDRHYVVKSGEVLIVDEFTGRIMEGRRWSDGLHQAVEAKEHLRIKEESQTIASITFQNFFKLYGKLAGMTGTAMTEANEFLNIYKLEVVNIPTNRPLLRNNFPDLIYGSEKEKYEAIVEHVAELHAIGRPLLIGTVSIERSELLSELLKQRGIPHEVLNAKQHAKEADIVSEAGYFTHVTIATNMAGRGTDIKLGDIELSQLLEHWKKWQLCPKHVTADMKPEKIEQECLELWVKRWLNDEAEFADKTPEQWQEILTAKWHEYGLHPLKVTDKVAELGGLHVIGTERHEARRIDNQLRGRCARQGDPGSSRFFLSLDDDLMRIFAPDRVKNILRKIGLSDGMPLEHGMVSRSIERAQRKVEERNFEIRKNLLEYDSVMNEQRTIIYQRRQTWLDGEYSRETFLDYFDDILGDKIREMANRETRPEERDLQGLCNWLQENFLIETTPDKLEEQLAPGNDIHSYLMEKITDAYQAKEKRIGAEEQREIEKYLLLQTLDRKWMDHLYAMDIMKESVHLRGYGGQDPKLIYKREGYDMFEELWGSLEEEVVELIMKITPVEEELEYSEIEIGDVMHGNFGAYESANEEAAANAGEIQITQIVRTEEKIGRNAPCSCGSGLKYKKCCGRK